MDFKCYRGDEFRVTFAELGSLRSIIPSGINIMALTATASKKTLDVVKQRLSLVDPIIIGSSPNRANIYLAVKPYMNLFALSHSLCDEIRLYRAKTCKTVIFCQSFTSCYQLYAVLKRELKEMFTHPIGYPDLHNFRLVDMFHSGCLPHVKENILSSFTKVECTLRIIIATSSFGMGIDCPDIRRIIHWGTPSDVEEYVQETGRAGRDEEPSFAILYPKTHHAITEEMKNYCSNETQCRRALLLKSFICVPNNCQSSHCKCCDICDAAYCL